MFCLNKDVSRPQTKHILQSMQIFSERTSLDTFTALLVWIKISFYQLHYSYYFLTISFDHFNVKTQIWNNSICPRYITECRIHKRELQRSAWATWAVTDTGLQSSGLCVPVIAFKCNNDLYNIPKLVFTVSSKVLLSAVKSCFDPLERVLWTYSYLDSHGYT